MTDGTMRTAVLRVVLGSCWPVVRRECTALVKQHTWATNASWYLYWHRHSGGDQTCCRQTYDAFSYRMHYCNTLLAWSIKSRAAEINDWSRDWSNRIIKKALQSRCDATSFLCKRLFSLAGYLVIKRVIYFTIECKQYLQILSYYVIK